MKSSSYSSSSSDQPPPKTESSLSSRINPRLKSSLRSSKKERLLYMSTISVRLKVQNQRKCIDYFRAKYYFHLISLLCCSIFLSGRNRAKFYFFGKFTIKYRNSIFGTSIFHFRYFRHSNFTKAVVFLVFTILSIFPIFVLTLEFVYQSFKLRVLLPKGSAQLANLNKT